MCVQLPGVYNCKVTYRALITDQSRPLNLDKAESRQAQQVCPHTGGRLSSHKMSPSLLYRSAQQERRGLRSLTTYKLTNLMVQRKYHKTRMPMCKLQWLVERKSDGVYE